MDKNTDSKDKTPRTTVVEGDAPRGFIPAVATLAVDSGEIAATTALGVTADVRTELAKASLTVIDASENVVKSVFAIARRVTQRLDGAATELLASVEKIVGTSASAARSTTKDAAQVFSGALNAVVAPKGN
jgi:4-hydroxy-3-methylbut-2-enyl diphosphate reductase IspH